MARLRLGLPAFIPLLMLLECTGLGDEPGTSYQPFGIYGQGVPHLPSSAVSAIPEAQALPSSFPNFQALEPL